jgi:Flp pilus assembly secretin CpaC
MKSRIRALVVAAIVLFSATAGARAEDDPVALGVGTAFRLFVERAFASVIVGDPAVVDVHADDDRSVLIEPLNSGETNLVFIDARGVVIANVRISVCGNSPSNGCPIGHSS